MVGLSNYFIIPIRRDIALSPDFSRRNSVYAIVVLTLVTTFISCLTRYCLFVAKMEKYFSGMLCNALDKCYKLWDKKYVS